MCGDVQTYKKEPKIIGNSKKIVTFVRSETPGHAHVCDLQELSGCSTVG